MNQQTYIGFGEINRLENILLDTQTRNVFLVTGKASYECCGAKAVLDTALSGLRVTRFSDFEVNPKIEDVEKGLELFKQGDHDLVVAVGGGSVIDIAKLINIFAAQNESPLNYIQGRQKIFSTGKPFVAIPTTSGSGTEATHFAVVYVDKSKYSVAHEFVLPTYAIIDPEFTMHIPPAITASTGMDALSQATESFWAVGSTDESKKYAAEAIELVMGNLEQSVSNPTENSRLNMARAALLAGQAINISKTTAPHALSYPFTSYFGIPHGHAVGLTLGKVLEYNSRVTEEDTLDPRGIEYVKATFKSLCELYGVSIPAEARKKVEALMYSIGLETDLAALGIAEKEQLEFIASQVNLERLGNNPREMSNKDLMGILQ